MTLFRPHIGAEAARERPWGPRRAQPAKPPAASPNVPALPGLKGTRVVVGCGRSIHAGLCPHFLPRLWSCSDGARTLAIHPGSAIASTADGWGGGGGVGWGGAAHASAEAACMLELGPAWEGPQRTPPRSCPHPCPASPPFAPSSWVSESGKEGRRPAPRLGVSVNSHDSFHREVALVPFGKWGDRLRQSPLPKAT